jgi:hypothetical protein
MNWEGVAIGGNLRTANEERQSQRFSEWSGYCGFSYSALACFSMGGLFPGFRDGQSRHHGRVRAANQGHKFPGCQRPAETMENLLEQGPSRVPKFPKPAERL